MPFNPSKAVISAIGKDAPGIVRDVAGVLYRYGASIEDSSMTILEGFFSMLMIVSFSKKFSYEALETDLKKIQRKRHLILSSAQFQSRPVIGPIKHHGQLHMMTVFGSDKPGIVYHICEFLAAKGINITDLNSKVIGREKAKNTYALAIEVEIPKTVKDKPLQVQLKKLAARLKVEITCKPLLELHL